MINNSHGKRMVPEYLVKGLEEAYAKTSGGTGSTINLLENIVDSKGNKRFVEGVGKVNPDISGLTVTYNKWSLSGSHLMFVLAGTLANGVTIQNTKNIVTYDNLPTYIFDKIFPVYNQFIEPKDVNAMASDYTSQEFRTVLSKDVSGINIVKNQNLTLTADRNFRIQFDLLIDTD